MLHLFHGGFNVTLPFWPLTHFGTRAAALQMLDNKLNEPWVDNTKSTQEAVLYECEFPKPENPYLIRDIGTPQPVCILNELYADRRIWGDWKTGFNKRIAAERELRSIYGSHHASEDLNNPRMIDGRLYVVEVLRNLGFDGLHYINKQEDPGHISYVVFDPAQITILSVTTVSNGVEFLGSEL